MYTSQFSPILFSFVALSVPIFSLIAPVSRANAQSEVTQKNGLRRKGNVLYRVPDGWKEVEKDAVTLLAPPNMNEDEKCVIFILPGQNYTGDLKTQFSTVLKGSINSGERILQEADFQTVPLGGPGVAVLQKLMAVEDSTGKKQVRAYYAAHPGKKRFEIIAIYVTSAELLEKYSSGLDTFLKSWTFANIGGKGVVESAKSVVVEKPSPRIPEPKAKAGELVGLYFGQEGQNQLNFATNSYNYVLIKRWYYFLPGGRVYYGLPKSGLSDFDWQNALQTEPQKCGFYRLEGGKIKIQWQGGEKEVVSDFIRGDGTIRIGRFTLEQMVSPAGLRLSGTYGTTNYVNTSNVFGSGGSVSSERTITFTSDGRFTEEGFFGFVQQSAGNGSGGSAGVNGSESFGGSGSYRVTVDGLELTYANGRKTHIPLQVPASASKNSRPEYILVNGAVYLKR